MSERERERGNEKESEGYTVSESNQVNHTVPVPNPEATAAPTGTEKSPGLYGRTEKNSSTSLVSVWAYGAVVPSGQDKKSTNHPQLSY